MVQINMTEREIAVKVVYYGPALSGKTTNLQMLHEMISNDALRVTRRTLSILSRVFTELVNNKRAHGLAVMIVALDKFQIRSVVTLTKIRTIQPTTASLLTMICQNINQGLFVSSQGGNNVLWNFLEGTICRSKNRERSISRKRRNQFRCEKIDKS